MSITNPDSSTPLSSHDIDHHSPQEPALLTRAHSRILADRDLEDLSLDLSKSMRRQLPDQVVVQPRSNPERTPEENMPLLITIPPYRGERAESPMDLPLPSPEASERRESQLLVYMSLPLR
jgi:hypothetical protein